MATEDEFENQIQGSGTESGNQQERNEQAGDVPSLSVTQNGSGLDANGSQADYPAWRGGFDRKLACKLCADACAAFVRAVKNPAEEEDFSAFIRNSRLQKYLSKKSALSLFPLTRLIFEVNN